MDMGFAITCSLARHRRPYHPVLVHRPAYLFHASFRPHLAVTPFRFARPSPPSGWSEDFHLQAVEHARRTREGGHFGRPFIFGELLPVLVASYACAGRSGATLGCWPGAGFS